MGQSTGIRPATAAVVDPTSHNDLRGKAAVVRCAPKQEHGSTANPVGRAATHRYAQARGAGPARHPRFAPSDVRRSLAYQPNRATAVVTGQPGRGCRQAAQGPHQATAIGSGAFRLHGRTLFGRPVEHHHAGQPLRLAGRLRRPPGRSLCQRGAGNTRHSIRTGPGHRLGSSQPTSHAQHEKSHQRPSAKVSSRVQSITEYASALLLGSRKLPSLAVPFLRR